MILAIVIFCFGPPIYYIGYIYASLNKHQGPGRSSAASRQSTIVFSHDWLGCFAISWARKKEHDACWIVKLNQSNTYICLKKSWVELWGLLRHYKSSPRQNNAQNKPLFFPPWWFLTVSPKPGTQVLKWEGQDQPATGPHAGCGKWGLIGRRGGGVPPARLGLRAWCWSQLSQ